MITFHDLAWSQFERTLIRERTKAGLGAARARGRVGGNPGLRAREPAALAKLARSRRAGRLADLLPGVDEWLPLVRRLRPETPWPEVAETVNAALPRNRRPFTKERLVRAVLLLVAEGLAEEGLLSPAPRRRTRRGALARSRAVEVAAALMAGRPAMTLAELGAELARLRHVPPRGGPSWASSSLKALLDRARAQGLLAPAGKQQRHPIATSSPPSLTIQAQKSRDPGEAAPWPAYVSSESHEPGNVTAG